MLWGALWGRNILLWGRRICHSGSVYLSCTHLSHQLQRNHKLCLIIKYPKGWFCVFLLWNIDIAFILIISTNVLKLNICYSTWFINPQAILTILCALRGCVWMKERDILSTAGGNLCQCLEGMEEDEGGPSQRKTISFEWVEWFHTCSQNRKRC